MSPAGRAGCGPVPVGGGIARVVGMPDVERHMVTSTFDEGWQVPWHLSEAPSGDVPGRTPDSRAVPPDGAAGTWSAG
ncbi:hypothetical protein FHX34_105512 [Actinoplanes teichomyceticus]|uniref:Uncharacterized protein n=1 Tax=Actinoplanes teichomyceticus TaxID=1867 RepID=A0A561VM07_ACTTI|nr:hypothetical protein FHX34_105512 [Actinoplanes teichomyceticus]